MPWLDPSADFGGVDGRIEFVHAPEIIVDVSRDKLVHPKFSTFRRPTMVSSPLSTVISRPDLSTPGISAWIVYPSSVDSTSTSGVAYWTAVDPGSRDLPIHFAVEFIIFIIFSKLFLIAEAISLVVSLAERDFGICFGLASSAFGRTTVRIPSL